MSFLILLFWHVDCQCKFLIARPRNVSLSLIFIFLSLYIEFSEPIFCCLFCFLLFFFVSIVYFATHQALLSLCIAMSFFYIGLVRGYSAPAVPSILKNNHELLPTPNIASWASEYFQLLERVYQLKEFHLLPTYIYSLNFLMKQKVQFRRRVLALEVFYLPFHYVLLAGSILL